MATRLVYLAVAFTHMDKTIGYEMKKASIGAYAEPELSSSAFDVLPFRDKS
jgi:hypothetical protein